MHRFGLFSAALMLAFVASPRAQSGDVQRINHVIVDLPGELELRQPVWQIPGRQRPGQRRRRPPPGRQGRQAVRHPAAAAEHQLQPGGARPALPGRPASGAVRHREVSSAPNQLTGDLVHRYYQEQYQIDGGKMDKFVAWSDAAGLVMSYYDASDMPEGKLAQQFTMLDNFFHAAFGGSFLNHQFLICACAPRWTDAPPSSWSPSSTPTAS